MFLRESIAANSHEGKFLFRLEQYKRYFGQRILFAIATATDLPLVQLTVAGMACWIAGKRRGATPAKLSAVSFPLSARQNTASVRKAGGGMAES